MDDNYQIYVNRVAQMTLPEKIKQQLQNMQKSAKFEQGKPVSFPGYTVMTPPYHDDPVNQDFYEHLGSIQQQLLQQIEPGLVIPVPTDSFHLTLADLIWEDSYRNAIAANPDFQTELIKQIDESFTLYNSLTRPFKPIQLQLFGLSLLPRSLVVCLVPNTEESYEQIIKLRRCIYQNAQLISLGIEQQYHFTAHIALGYIGDIPEDLDRDRLQNVITDINNQWLDCPPPIFHVNQAELRKFEDMMSYQRENNWSQLSLIN